jgi:hypothetical protein
MPPLERPKRVSAEPAIRLSAAERGAEAAVRRIPPVSPSAAKPERRQGDGVGSLKSCKTMKEVLRRETYRTAVGGG